MMNKYLWGIAAGVFDLALIVVAVIFVPQLLERSPATIVPEGHEIMMPGHWWQADLTEQQLGTLSAYYGQSITFAELLQTLWPEVLQEMPEEARPIYEHQGLSWPPEKYEDWDGSQFLCAGTGAPHDGGQWVYSYYIGTREWEEMTLVENTDLGFTEDRMYRVSLYIDGQPE